MIKCILENLLILYSLIEITITSLFRNTNFKEIFQIGYGFALVCFYGISTVADHLMLTSFHTYIKYLVQYCSQHSCVIAV